MRRVTTPVRSKDEPRWCGRAFAALLALGWVGGGCDLSPSASPPEVAAAPSAARARVRWESLEELELPAATRRAVVRRCVELLDWVVRDDPTAFAAFVATNREAVERLRGLPASSEQLGIAAKIAALQEEGFRQAQRLLARDLELSKAKRSPPIALRWEVERRDSADGALFFDLFALLQFDHGELGWHVGNFCSFGDQLVLCGNFWFEIPDDR